MQRRMVVLMVFVLMIGLVSSASLAADKTLTIAIQDDVSDLDPGFGSTISVNEKVINLIFDGLVEYGEGLSLIPGIAKSWDISEDGTTYTFYLRDGIKFHNGQTLTAEDVKYTYERILDPEAGSGQLAKVELIDSIAVLDDLTVQFQLQEPYAPFLLSAAFGVVPKDYVETVGKDHFARNPVGSGPFRLVEWKSGDRLVLKANEDYYLGRPSLDTVVIRPISEPTVQAIELKSGGIDVATNLGVPQLEELKQDSRFEIASAPGDSIHFVGFMDSMPPYDNVDLRKVLYMATPFDQAVPSMYNNIGVRAYSWISPTLWPDDLEYMKSHALAYNPSEAKKLYDQLVADGVVPRDFVVDVWTAPSSVPRLKMAEIMVTSLQQIGIKARTQVIEFGTLMDKMGAEETGVYFFGFGSDADPDFWLYRWFRSDGSLNFSKYADADVDQWLDAAKATTDQKERGELYKKVLRRALTEDYVHIPFAFLNDTVVYNKNVQGLRAGFPGHILLMSPIANVDIVE